MAHPCFICGSECYCQGDIDDVIVSKTPKGCEGCGCGDDKEIGDIDDSWFEDLEFIPCDKCDGHDACADFGCAIEAGLRHLVKKDLTSDDL